MLNVQVVSSMSM